jgi:hypothetical protein
MQHSKRSAWIKWAKAVATKIDIFFFASVLCCALCRCTQQDDQKKTERHIIESERQWAESVASGDSGPVERILADDFVGVNPQGHMCDKPR